MSAQLPPPPFPTNFVRPRSTPSSKPILTIPLTPPSPNSRLVFLLVYNGWPFADHWEYFIPSAPSTNDTNIGTVIQAKGNVRDGFELEIRRAWDLNQEGCVPDEKVGLGWVGEGLFEGLSSGLKGEARDDGGERGDETGVGKGPVFEFERYLFKVPAPEKTLRRVGGEGEDMGEVSHEDQVMAVLE